MIRIAACDDEPIILRQLQQYCTELTEYEIEMDMYDSVESLSMQLECEGISYHIYLLDINVHNLNGMEIAKKIRQQDPHAIIIFITGYTEYMEEAFEVTTFRYLVKPVSKERFQEAIRQSIAYMGKVKPKFVFQTNRDYFSVPCEDIMYMEKDKRIMQIHTRDREYQCYMTVGNAMKQLPEQHFMQLSSAAVVNLDYVTKIAGNTVWLDNDMALSGSRSYIGKMKKRFKELTKRLSH